MLLKTTKSFSNANFKLIYLGNRKGVAEMWWKLDHASQHQAGFRSA